MPSPFHWLERLGKVVVLRLKRPKNQGRTQDVSITANCEGHSSTPTDLSHSWANGLAEFYTGSPSSEYPFGTSTVREISDIAQVVLPSVQTVTSVIPVAGTAMNAVIGGLLATLQVINRCDQNKAALDSLKLQLYRLSQHLYNTPLASDPLEYYRRDVLTRKLQDTSASLRKLPKRRLLYPSVTQAITGCSTDIDHYLTEYLLSSQIQMQRETHKLSVRLQRWQEGSQYIEQSVALGCVTLVDATGRHHQISVNLCTSYQQLNDMLQILFKRDVIQAKIQRQYIEQGQYDLCIDKGTEVTPLTSHEWPSIEPGTKIVMRVTIQQETGSASDINYQCHFCSAVNRLGITSVKYENQTQISGMQMKLSDHSSPAEYLYPEAENMIL
ncbi:hypothetical protein BDR04DRAFT_1149201 [Suillus decipiens]|nr:hypothetical protein BDR04DRAFT_1149201 [Suillus decipiens]